MALLIYLELTHTHTHDVFDIAAFHYQRERKGGGGI